MNQVDECLDKLIAAVLASEEYRQYQKIREKIKREPEKEKAISADVIFFCREARIILICLKR